MHRTDCLFWISLKIIVWIPEWKAKSPKSHKRMLNLTLHMLKESQRLESFRMASSFLWFGAQFRISAGLFGTIFLLARLSVALQLLRLWRTVPGLLLERSKRARARTRMHARAQLYCWALSQFFLQLRMTETFSLSKVLPATIAAEVKINLSYFRSAA